MGDLRNNLTGQNQMAYSTFKDEIFLNALPHFLDRIDLTEVEQEGDLFTYNFLENLFKSMPFEMEVFPSFFTGEKFRHLYFESRNKERLKGPKTFGFGFPLFIRHEKDYLMAAPVFIWKLSLEPISNNTEGWKVVSRETPKATVNPALKNWLKDKYEEDSFLLDNLVGQNTLTSSEVLKNLNDMAATLCLDESYQHISISPGPSVEELDAIPPSGTIHWSGVFGVYPPNQSSNLLDVDESLFQPKLLPSEGHEFGLLETDPYQASALKSIFRNKLTVVDGESGTGKTHLILHLLSNILLNGEKCLLVSESIPALQEVQRLLSNMGINQFQFLIRDMEQDRVLFQELLRAAMAEAPEVEYTKDQLAILLDKAERQKSRLDENFRTLNKNVFGSSDWTETVGRFLKSNRLEGKELLASQLNNSDYSFSLEEFEKLKGNIEVSHPLYAKINTLNHPLQILNHNIFKDLNKTDGLAFIQQQIDLFSEKAGRLQQKFINKQNEYSDALLGHYDQVHRSQIDIYNKITEKIKDFSNQYGDLFREHGRGTLRFYGLFSGKHKQAAKAKLEIASLFGELQKTYKETDYFDFNFSLNADEKNIGKVEKELEAFGLELEAWRNRHNALVQEDLSRLSNKNTHYQLNFKDQVEDLEYGLDRLIEDLNEARLYQLPLENKMLTIPKRQKYLEEIIEQLENTKLSLRDYEPFYDWQHNWLSLTEKARKVVRAMVKVKPGSWVVAFESWYLNNILNNAYEPSLLPEMDMVVDFHKNEQELRPLLSSYLQDHSQLRQESAIKALKRKDRNAFNFLFSKKKEDSAYPPLKDLFDRGASTIMEVLPILMTTPDVALELMGSQDESFDYILIDEAQYAPLSKAPALFKLAKKQVLFGNSNQLRDQDYSVFGEAIAMGVRNYKLKEIHRYQPANLFQSENQEKFEDQMANYKVHFAQVDGRFNEEEQTNEAEAQYIIRLLNQINKTPQRTFPTVGIVCFTSRQRDLILDYLLKIQQKRSPGAEKIQQLERNGMGVYCIDELAGQHFDILFVSGTYCIIDSKGNVMEHIDWLNNSQGAAMINMLMGRTLHELFIVNSLPQNELKALTNGNSSETGALLANYFLYARACEMNDNKSKRAILERFSSYFKKDSTLEDHFIFRQELAIAMQPYLKPGRIDVKYQNGLSPYPILVKGQTEDRPAILLWPDGFASSTYATDFRWEQEQINDLKNKGLIHLPVWTVNWWRNPDNEARKLASTIIKIDEEEIPIEE